MADDTRVAARVAAVNTHKAGHLDEALRAYSAYLTQHPMDAGIWTNLGALFRAKGQHEMGRTAQMRAYALAPDDMGVRNNYANILSDLGDYAASIELRKASLAEDPSHLMHHAMIGRCLRGMGQYQEAIDYLTPMVAKYPQESEIKLQLAFAQLGAGHYGAAFRSYEARWETDELEPPQIPLPKWEEGVSLKGKTLLVMPEQGFGDMVLLTRFIPVIAKLGAKVRLVVKKPLLRLLSGIDGVDWVGPHASKDDPIDYWVNLMDLPKIVIGADEAGDVPAPTILNVPDDSVVRARTFTAQHQHMLKVGVVWSGSATYKGNSFRSFTHREFLLMANIPNVQLFSLYKGPFLEAFEADGSSALMVDTASTDRDFADAAATMKEMDLIITSDTATAHIAGSLGVPTWVMLHWDAFWVYRHAGETTDWYPNMRLFRQAKPQDWASAFDAVTAALVERVNTHG